jgi:putative transposase
MQVQKKNNSVYKLGIHLVFCTKYRKKIFSGAMEVELKHILSQTCAGYDWKVKNLEIMPDHVHMFIQVGPKDRPEDIAKTLKNISAVYIFTKFPTLKGRKFWGSGLWSDSTYYGSVGEVEEEVISRYIENQHANSSQPTRGQA